MTYSLFECVVLNQGDRIVREVKLPAISIGIEQSKILHHKCTYKICILESN